MTKRVLSREQRGDVESCLATWSEFSRGGMGGFVSAQWSAVRSGDFSSSVPVPPVVDAVEFAVSLMAKHDQPARELIVWLWLERNVGLTKIERAGTLRVHVSTYERWEDRAYVQIWNAVVDHGIIAGKKIAA